MNKSYLALYLMLAVGSAIGMESSDPSEPSESTSANTPRALSNGAFSRFYSRMADDSNSTKFNIKRFIYKPTDTEKILLTQSLANASTEVHTKIYEEKYLPSTPRSNFLFLTGDPGMGKSTLANAIAMALTSEGGTIYSVNSGDLSHEHRNATSAFLNNLMTEIALSQEKSVLIINELNKILENHTSEHTDTGDTAATLWQNLDKNMSNLNFFFIGTANETKKIPVQLQDRFLVDFIKITTPQETARLEQMQHFIKKLNIPKDDTITDAYIRDLARRTNSLSHRRIQQLCEQAKKYAIAKEIVQHKDAVSLFKPILTRQCFEAAANLIMSNLQEFCNFSSPMTDEEKRHQEIRKDNREHFEQNKKMHEETTKLNKEQFEENKKIQAEAQKLNKDQFEENQKFQQKLAKFNSDVQVRLANCSMMINCGKGTMSEKAAEIIGANVLVDFYKIFRPKAMQELQQVKDEMDRRKEEAEKANQKQESETPKKGWFGW